MHSGAPGAALSPAGLIRRRQKEQKLKKACGPPRPGEALSPSSRAEQAGLGSTCYLGTLGLHGGSAKRLREPLGKRGDGLGRQVWCQPMRLRATPHVAPCTHKARSGGPPLPLTGPSPPRRTRWDVSLSSKAASTLLPLCPKHPPPGMPTNTHRNLRTALLKPHGSLISPEPHPHPD